MIFVLYIKKIKDEKLGPFNITVYFLVLCWYIFKRTFSFTSFFIKATCEECYIYFVAANSTVRTPKQFCHGEEVVAPTQGASSSTSVAPNPFIHTFDLNIPYNEQEENNEGEEENEDDECENENEGEEDTEDEDE